ncbi:MAG: hypothetical protein ACE5H1_08455, partial [Thermodesulfobacteriota bacterium]
DEYNRYLENLLSGNNYVIAIDDFARVDLPFDIRVIPYYGAERAGYKASLKTKLLLGPAYFIFQPEFTKAACIERKIKKESQNILITMGGSDPFDLTVKVVSAITRVPFLNIHLRVVIGPGFKNVVKQAIEKNLRNFLGEYEIVEGNGSMVELMHWSDLALIAGGLTKYEAAVTGTPCISISPFKRELKMAEMFEMGGSLLHLGIKDQVSLGKISEAVKKVLGDFTLRETMSKKGKRLVDGKGIEKIIAEIPKHLLL